MPPAAALLTSHRSDTYDQFVEVEGFPEGLGVCRQPVVSTGGPLQSLPLEGHPTQHAVLCCFLSTQINKWQHVI